MKKNENTNTENIMKSVRSTILVLAILISAAMTVYGGSKSSHSPVDPIVSHSSIVTIDNRASSEKENRTQTSVEMWDEMMENVNAITNAL